MFTCENVYAFSCDRQMIPGASLATKKCHLTLGRSLWAGPSLQGVLKEGSLPGCTSSHMVLLLFPPNFLSGPSVPCVLSWVPNFLVKVTRGISVVSEWPGEERERKERKRISFSLLQRKGLAFTPVHSSPKANNCLRQRLFPSLHREAIAAAAYVNKSESKPVNASWLQNQTLRTTNHQQPTRL